MAVEPAATLDCRFRLGRPGLPGRRSNELGRRGGAGYRDDHGGPGLRLIAVTWP